MTASPTFDPVPVGLGLSLFLELQLGYLIPLGQDGEHWRQKGLSSAERSALRADSRLTHFGVVVVFFFFDSIDQPFQALLHGCKHVSPSAAPSTVHLSPR